MVAPSNVWVGLSQTAWFWSSWLYITGRGATNGVVFDMGIQLLSGGISIRSQAASTIVLWIDAGGTARAATIAVAVPLNTWTFVYGGINTAGNYVIAVDGVEVTGVSLNPLGVRSHNVPTVGMRTTGVAGWEITGAYADMRMYNRILNFGERQMLYRDKGGDGIVEGALSRLNFLGQPGTNTAAALPRDLIRPATNWTMTGGVAGVNEYQWQGSPYPRKRSRRH